MLIFWWQYLNILMKIFAKTFCAGEYLRMPTPITSTLYPSTQTRSVQFWDCCLFVSAGKWPLANTFFFFQEIDLWICQYIFFFFQETYLSADDLRINLWHMEITDQSFNIVDIKPANMEELTEVYIEHMLITIMIIDHTSSWSTWSSSHPVTTLYRTFLIFRE